MRRKSPNRPKWRSWPVVIAVLIIVLGGGYLGARSWYNRNLAAVNTAATQEVDFTVVSGSTVQEIGSDLKRADLIRSTQAFETYVRGRGYFDKLQAGTYRFSQAMSTPQIVDKMVDGDVAQDLLTILPGKTIKQIRQAFKDAGYSDAELDIAFSPVTYAGHPVLAGLPAGATLEGFLYPDSYQKIASTPPTAIVRQSLDEMEAHLTPDIVRGFKAAGLTTYQGVTLASIVYQESDDAASEPTVAQVFLSRLKDGMMLGSDVTAYYAADLAGAGKTLGVDSPYNTRIHTGLPPGPIGNMLDSAMKAVAHPSNTDYLYFVAGDDGRLHFARTAAQHQQNIDKYCKIQCAQ